MKRWRDIFKPVTWRSKVKPISFQHSSENRAKDSKFKRNVNWVIYVVLFQLLDLCKEAVLRVLQLNNKDDSELLISLFSVFNCSSDQLKSILWVRLSSRLSLISNGKSQILFFSSKKNGRLSLNVLPFYPESVWTSSFLGRMEFYPIRRIFPIIHSIMKLNPRTEISKWLNKLGN